MSSAEHSQKSEEKTTTVLSTAYNTGPKNVGDPNDRSLRKVEREILIPQIMRDRAKAEKCIPEAKEFENCCKDAGLLMTFKCKPQTKVLYACLEKWYKDEDFKGECTEQYLAKRSAFRNSGVSEKMKKKKSDMF